MSELQNSIKEQLDFSEIDLTPPNEVIEQILSELPSITNNIVLGKLDPYSGRVESYTSIERSALAVMMNVKEEKFVDIQKDLGKLGEEIKKYECVLYTPIYDKYKYRIFFIKYGIAKYPVRFVLEESIANSIESLNSRCIVDCKNRAEVENLMNRIMSSKKLISIIQELIRINQVKRNEPLQENAENC